MQDGQEQAAVKMRVAQLRQEHEDFKVAIEAMVATGVDPLCVQRMKKKKLDVKDRLERMASQIIPDIIA